MVLAAIDSQLSGKAAFQDTKDPVTGTPFTVSEFQHQGEIVGFILTSKLDDDRDKRHLFLLKPVPNLQLSGNNIGDSN